MSKFLIFLLAGLIISALFIEKALAQEDPEHDNENDDDGSEPEEKIPIDLNDLKEVGGVKAQGDDTVSYDGDGNVIDNTTFKSESIKGSFSREDVTDYNETDTRFSNASASDDEYSSEKWNEVMQDFTPDDILTFDVDAWGQEVLYEDIQDLSVIRGAYFVSSEEDEQIDFTIYSPDGSILFQRAGRRDGLFRFKIEKFGVYMIQFSNEKFLKSKTVTFAFHATHKMKTGHLKRDHVTELDMKLKKTSKALNLQLFQTRFTEKRQETHYQTILSTHNKLLGFTLFETLAILATTIIQIYYIEQLLQNKIVV